MWSLKLHSKDPKFLNKEENMYDKGKRLFYGYCFLLPMLLKNSINIILSLSVSYSKNSYFMEQKV